MGREGVRRHERVAQKKKNKLNLNGIVSALPHHSGRSLPQPLDSATSELSNPALGTVTQGRVGGSEGDMETIGGGGGVLVEVLLG